MAINRIRARLRFTKASGLASWCKSNMGVRYTQAISINEGQLNEESKENDFVDDAQDHQIYSCDLPLMNQSHAIDAFNTLNVVANQSVLFDDDTQIGFIERHTCYHDETPIKPCVINEKVLIESNPAPSPTIEVWVQPTGGDGKYVEGAIVTHNGRTWENTHTGSLNVWEPGVFGWTDIGPA